MKWKKENQYRGEKKMKKTNSKITSSALNKNKQQHLKQKKWLAKINEIKKKKKNWSTITWVAKKWFANKKNLGCKWK